MAINRFALVTDGFDKPGEYVGNDFSTKTGRALLITWGLWNHEFGEEGHLSLYKLLGRGLKKLLH